MIVRPPRAAAIAVIMYLVGPGERGRRTVVERIMYARHAGAGRSPAASAGVFAVQRVMPGARRLSEERITEARRTLLRGKLAQSAH